MTSTDWIRPDWPVPPGVQAIITTRAGGSSTGAYGAPNRDGMNLGLEHPRTRLPMQWFRAPPADLAELMRSLEFGPTDRPAAIPGEA